jgi:hypothetical protein
MFPLLTCFLPLLQPLEAKVHLKTMFHKQRKQRLRTPHILSPWLSMTPVFDMSFLHKSISDSLHLTVPVYDARKNSNFSFRFADLQNVRNLPLFKKGTADPSGADYIATVAYTVGTFKYGATNSRIMNQLSISMHVMFVVVLGRMRTK